MRIKSLTIQKNWIIAFSSLIFLFLIALFWHQASRSIINQINNSSQVVPFNSPAPVASDSAKPISLRLFFVALNDNGVHGEKLGCSDSVAPVKVDLPSSSTPLQVIIEQLLLTKQETVGPSKLYNSLAKSDLQFKDAKIKNGLATIHLTGKINLSGDCDYPRFQSQLEKTAQQFSDVKSVQIFINDKPLTEIKSLN